MKTVFITGGSGYVGSFLVQRLLNQGFHIKLLLREPLKAESLNGILKNSDIEVVNASLEVENVYENVLRDVDIVFHLASVLNIYEKENILKTVNIDGTEKLVRNLINLQRKMHFIFTSSIEAQGPSSKKLIPFNSKPRPVSDYGKSKLAAENLIKEMLKNNSLINYTIFRVGNVYSENKGMEKGFLDIILNSPGLFRILYHVLGEFTLHFIHVEDVIYALSACIDNEKTWYRQYYLAYERIEVLKYILYLAQKHGIEIPVKLPFFAEYRMWRDHMKKRKPLDLVTYISCGGLWKKHRFYETGRVFNELGFTPMHTIFK